MILALGLTSLAVAVAIVLLLGGRGGSSRRKATAAAPGGPSPGTSPQPRHCPLCGSLLGRGEKVKSDLVRGGGDSIMRIFGCPHCWPVPAEGLDRTCPVCRSSLSQDGHAVARYFERPGRKHVHVLGCTECRGPGTRRT